MEMQHDDDRERKKGSLERAQDAGQHVPDSLAMQYGVHKKKEVSQFHPEANAIAFEGGSSGQASGGADIEEPSLLLGTDDDVHIVSDANQAEALREMMEAEGRSPTIINTQDDDRALEREDAKKAVANAREVTVWNKNESTEEQQNETDRNVDHQARSAYALNKNIQVAKPPEEHRDLAVWNTTRKQTLDHNSTLSRSAR